MSPKKLALAAVAVVLVLLMVVVWFANPGGLSRELKAEIRNEQQSYTQAKQQFQSIRDAVNRDVRSEPALFQARNLAVVLPERLNKAELKLQEAGNDVTALEKLAKADRKRDKQQVELLLHTEAQARKDALQQANDVQSETKRLVAFKKDLPGALRKMEQEYKSIQGADLAAVTSAVQKAQADWPAKKDDLESKLTSLKNLTAEADKQYQATAAQRASASAADAPALAAASDAIHEAATNVKSRAESLQAQTGQLYNAYDKILVDLEKGEDYTYKEKVKTITTHFTDVAANKTEVQTAENWFQVSPDFYRGHEKDLGMTIEHKAAGKYDSEADKVAQPPGFGYIARPEEGRNRYGYWNNSGPSPFWTWYPAYLMLGRTFGGYGYAPPSVIEYHNYYTTHSTGQTYYGTDTVTQRPKYGTLSDGTASRYSSSKYVNSGSYQSSKYASSGNTSSGSKFGSSGSTGQQGSRYGSSGSTYRSGSGSYRSSPMSRPSPSMGGRRFGGRR